MKLAIALDAERQEAAKIDRVAGGFVVEPMRFLYPFQAKRERNAQYPKQLSHVCHRRDYRSTNALRPE